MNWFEANYLEGAAVLVGGIFVGFWVARYTRNQSRAALQRHEAEILENAQREAASIIREAKLSANEEILKLREQTEKSYQNRRLELSETENRIAQRESLINTQLEALSHRENGLRQQHEQLEQQNTAVQDEKKRLQALISKRTEELERLSHFSQAEARALLLRSVEVDSLRDAADLSRHIVEEARLKAEGEARRIISLAIQRFAGQHTFETTTSTVAIQGDEIKGKIIGREGRNIRAFEAATGVTVMIDDTPNAVVLSGFDPVRREIARESMQRLILDGRIHPTRIEEIVAKVSQETEEAILRAGEEAIYKLGLPPMHIEIIKKLGALKFRHSFSQNILDHSIEVAQLMVLMAAELGVDLIAAKKAGLLHDIGKSMSHEIEGSHAIVGADFVKRHGEAEDVVNGVASHHDEVPHTNLLGILVSAADAMSASRPGARSESMTTYLKRLEHLEQIGLSFEGVEKCFAVQAGRELRVVVQPSKVSDDEATALARNIVRKIEDELQYPGQIRVTVVRETRCVEYAK
jgi:ribonuclease Y